MAFNNQEVWTDVLVKEFDAFESAGFLDLIPDESRHVSSSTRGENEVIHLVDIGDDPEVITNNITYPIGVETQTDGNIAISLDTHVTKATKVAHEETQYIAYDKIALVQEKHKHAIMVRKHDKAVHALAPLTNKKATPVLLATGPDDGTGRKRVVRADFIRLSSEFNDAGIPFSGRGLILTSKHYEDLKLEADEKKKSDDFLKLDQNGKFLSLFETFTAFVYLQMPYFNINTREKLAFGATPLAIHRMATVAFYGRDMFKASGNTWTYADKPTTQNHAWMYNARHNYIVLPKKERAIAALVSPNA